MFEMVSLGITQALCKANYQLNPRFWQNCHFFHKLICPESMLAKDMKLLVDVSQPLVVEKKTSKTKRECKTRRAGA